MIHTYYSKISNHLIEYDDQRSTYRDLVNQQFGWVYAPQGPANIAEGWWVPQVPHDLILTEGL